MGARSNPLQEGAVGAVLQTRSWQELHPVRDLSLLPAEVGLAQDFLSLRKLREKGSRRRGAKGRLVSEMSRGPYGGGLQSNYGVSEHSRRHASARGPSI